MITSANAVRYYKLALGILLIAVGTLVKVDHELGRYAIPQVNFVVFIMMLLAGSVALLACLFNNEDWYWASYFFTTTSLSIWTFTLTAYAAFSLVPPGEVMIFAYVLIQNGFLFPFLLSERRTAEAIRSAGEAANHLKEHRSHEPA